MRVAGENGGELLCGGGEELRGRKVIVRRKGVRKEVG